MLGEQGEFVKAQPVIAFFVHSTGTLFFGIVHRKERRDLSTQGHVGSWHEQGGEDSVIDAQFVRTTQPGSLPRFANSWKQQLFFDRDVA